MTRTSTCFLILCGAVLLGTLAGCNTPRARARCRPGAFGKLSSEDRKLVLAGKVHPGMSPAAVYIAWGEPDTKQRAGDGKDPAQTWIYRRLLTLQAPMDSFDRWPVGNGGFSRVTPLTTNPGFGFGGLGYEGTLRYQPHLLTTQDTVRRADFENGRLIHFELFQAGDTAAR